MPKRSIDSDEEKRKKGTLQAGQTEEDYDRAHIERTILPFPVMSELPVSQLPLDDTGNAKYVELATMLLKAGRLTVMTQTAAEQLAMQHQAMAMEMNKGKVPSASRLTQIRRLMDDLGLGKIDKPIQGTGKTEENPFDTNGFAARRRFEASQA